MADLTSLDWQIIQIYADNNMNMAETARQCYMHRNTLEYHLDKVKRETGLDPKRFCDLVKLIGGEGAMTGIPFAGILEESIKALAVGKAQNVAVCGRLEDGSMLTSFANMDAEDLAVAAWHIFSSAIMEVVVANADMVKAAMDELEEDDG